MLSAKYNLSMLGQIGGPGRPNTLWIFQYVIKGTHIAVLHQNSRPHWFIANLTIKMLISVMITGRIHFVLILFILFCRKALCISTVLPYAVLSEKPIHLYFDNDYRIWLLMVDIYNILQNVPTSFTNWPLGDVAIFFKNVIFKHLVVRDPKSRSCDIDINWMPTGLIDNKSTFVKVMTWCCQATSHYLSQCAPSHCLNRWWPSSMSPYGVTSP